MNNNQLLMTAMAEECRARIKECAPHSSAHDLPPSLQPRHLEWMCRAIVRCVEEWPHPRLHRWIGFIQCGMLANRMVDQRDLMNMFDQAKAAYGDSSDDLADHLDPSSAFELDIGGQG